MSCYRCFAGGASLATPRPVQSDGGDGSGRRRPVGARPARAPVGQAVAAVDARLRSLMLLAGSFAPAPTARLAFDPPCSPPVDRLVCAMWYALLASTRLQHEAASRSIAHAAYRVTGSTRRCSALGGLAASSRPCYYCYYQSCSSNT